MTSLVSASTSFSALTSPGDAIAVLVLVETSGIMLSYWDEVKTFYLPVLLDTLRNAHDLKTIPMRVCWQTSQTVFAGNQAASAGDATGKEIPEFRFDPASTSAVSTTALQYSIETLKAAFRDQHATRHLIVVAASPPTDNFNKVVFDPNSLESIASNLRQEKIRFHIILGTRPNSQVYHQLHQRVLLPQNCRAVPLWFSADAAKFNILLMGKPSSSSVEGVSSFPSSSGVSSTHSQGSDTPVSTGSSLPSSPSHNDSFSSERRKSLSPQTRRGRLGSMEQPAHGLVSYLQQMHGLTKKRTYGGGGKTIKRASTGEAPRSSSSSRPILPRLDLSDHRSRGFSPYPPMGSPTSERPPRDKSPPSIQHRYTHVAPASSPASPSDDGQRSRGRWPWIQPAPLPSLSSGSSSSSASVANALRSLAMMTPRNPELAARLPDLTPTRNESVTPAGMPQQPFFRSDTSYDMSISSSTQLRRDSTSDWHHRQRSSTISTTHYADYRMSATPSPTHTARGYDPSWLPGHYGHPAQGYSHDHYLPSHDHIHPAYTQMVAPLPVSQSSSTTDPGDQPFLITPEFEALANARFDEAVRSGAMQASMTAVTLGSVADNTLSQDPTVMAPSGDAVHAAPADVPITHSTHLLYPDSAAVTNYDHAVGLNDPIIQASGLPHSNHISHNRHLPAHDPTQDRWYGL